MFGTFYPDGTPYPLQGLPLSRSILRGESVLGEQMLIRNAETGELNMVLVNSVPLRDSDGTITGGAAVFQDISSLKEFERQRDEFLQAVSHDLKNPLTTIQGYAQMLRKTFMEDSERSELAIGHIESATKRAIAMLDELLDLTRLQMGHPLELTRVDMDLVQLAMRLAEQYETTSHSHEVSFISSLPTLKGYWDEIRLERVFGNVLSNAIRYSPEGGRITIRVDREADESDGFAKVEVQDEGIGIPQKELPHLFERFWRGSNVREQYHGTGLGLAGAKAIVDAHGGDIDVQSAEGQGSTFTIRLPLNEMDTGNQE